MDFRLLPLVAREGELSAVVEDGAPLVLIVGDAGVGKTRLASEACQRVSGDDVFVVRFTEMSSATPFHGVAHALRAPVVLARLAALDEHWRRDLVRLLPELRIGHEPFEVEASTPLELRSRMLEALAQALAQVADGSAALLFDDLHLADASSLELLVHLTRRRAQAPTGFPRVVGTARGHELPGNPAAISALEDIERHPGLTRLTLDGLDAPAMLRLVQTLSGQGGGVRFAARLGAATGGNVFFALETIRALFEAGELQADPTDGWHTRYDETTTDYSELPLPASVVDTVSARVARLGPTARRVLETAALAQDGSTLVELRSATALTDWEALDGIERAVDAHVLTPAGGGYRFVHDLFPSAIRKSLSPERQRLTHAKLAATLEHLQAPAARVAAHWQAAGESRAAAAAWVRAATAAVALYAHIEASAHYERAALLSADEEAAFALHDQAFNHLAFVSRDRERRAMVERLLVRAKQTRSPTVNFRVLVRAAQSAMHDRDYARAEGYALRALDDFEPPNAVVHIHALSCAAYAAGHGDRRVDALARYRQALAVAQQYKVDRAVAMMAASASRMAVHLNLLDEASALRDEALGAGNPDDASIHRAQALNNVSFLARALGRRDEAVAQLQQAADIARAIRSDLYLQIYLANLCETLVDDGRLADARAAQQELRSTFPDATEPLARYLSALTAAVVEELQGDLGAAIEFASAAVAAADDLGDLPDRRESRFLAARLTALTGAVEQARPWVDEAATLVRPGGAVPMLPLACFRASLMIDQDPLAAQALLDEALAQPFADRLMHPHLETARILRARCELARGQAAVARKTVATVRHSVANESQAIVVRLAATAGPAAGARAAVEAGQSLIERGVLPPAHALALMRALSNADASIRGRRPVPAGPLRPRMQTLAQALADSLRGRPALQAAWIRQHRDLLT